MQMSASRPEEVISTERSHFAMVVRIARPMGHAIAIQLFKWNSFGSAVAPLRMKIRSDSRVKRTVVCNRI
jgi:hypothetical protein